MGTPEHNLTGGEPALYVVVTRASWGGDIPHDPVSREQAQEDIAFYEECRIPVVAVHEFLYNGQVGI